MIWAVAIALAVLCLAACIVMWIGERRGVAARPAMRRSDGTQEARVIVDHGYHPARIDLEAGVPTTLRFDRREDDPCSELLVSELWPNAHRLAAHGETDVRFTPEHPGRYVFTCGFGMYSGELLVHERRSG